LHHRLAPHHQVQLLWLITVAAVVAVVVTGPLALSGAEGSITTADSRLVPASAQLATAMRNDGAGETELLNVLQTADEGTRAAAVSSLTNFNTAANNAWKNYEHLSLHLPGEAKLQAKAELDTQQFAALGEKLLTSPVSATGDAGFTALAAQQQQDLAHIQALYQTRIAAVVTSAHQAFAARERDLTIVAAVVLVVTMIAFSVVTHSIRRRYRVQVDEVRRNELESGLQRALEMARTEQDCYTLVHHAIERSSPDLRSELLIADSSRAHFH